MVVGAREVCPQELRDLPWPSRHQERSFVHSGKPKPLGRLLASLRTIMAAAKPAAANGSIARSPLMKLVGLPGSRNSLKLPGLMLNHSIAHSPRGNKMAIVDHSSGLEVVN